MKFFIWLLLAYIGYRIVKQLANGSKKSVQTEVTGSETFQDPVCGVYVAKEDATVGRLGEDKIYFCSRDCLDRYQEKLQNR